MYYYMHISLNFEGENVKITPAFFKENIVRSVRILFKSNVCSGDIDILKYNPDTLNAVLRVPKNLYVKVHAGLTFCGTWQGKTCYYIVHKQFGKDKVIFATEEDHKVPSKITLPEPDPQPGLILPNGDINWNCPCLGGMATGPCGFEFRNAFSCFHYSETDPKGSDCFEKFKTMQTCMQKYPTLYNKDIADDDDFTGLDEPKGSSTESVENKESKLKPESEIPSKDHVKN